MLNVAATVLAALLQAYTIICFVSFPELRNVHCCSHRLGWAVLCCAVLCCAVLRCAVLCCAVLCSAVLCCAAIAALFGIAVMLSCATSGLL